MAEKNGSKIVSSSSSSIVVGGVEIEVEPRQRGGVYKVERLIWFFHRKSFTMKMCSLI